MADFEPYRGGGMDPLKMFMQLHQLKQSRELQEQQSREEGVNLGLKLAAVQDPREFDATVRYLQQVRNLGPGEAEFLRGTNMTASKQKKAAEAKESLPALASAGTPALTEGGETQYAPLQREGFAAQLRQLATTLRPEDYAQIVSQASGMIGAGTGAQGRQVATEGRQEAQSIRAGQRAEARDIRSQGRSEAAQRRLLQEQVKAGRTEFERLVNDLPEDQRQRLRATRAHRLAQGSEGFSVTTADGTTFASGAVAIKKQEQELLDSHVAAVETATDLGTLIGIIEQDPTIAGSIGSARNLSSNIVGILTDAGKASAAQSVERYISDTLGAAATDVGIPEQYRAQANGLLIDPGTRGTLEALNFALTYSQVRASRTGRPSERDFERAQKAVGIRGFRESEQVLSTLRTTKSLAERRARATKLQIDRTPGITELSQEIVDSIRSGGDVSGTAPSVSGIDFEYDPETGRFREVGQ